jgi:hypothetical protein
VDLCYALVVCGSWRPARCMSVIGGHAPA